jgi:hypothetical protein
MSRLSQFLHAAHARPTRRPSISRTLRYATSGSSVGPLAGVIGLRAGCGSIASAAGNLFRPSSWDVLMAAVLLLNRALQS